MEPYIAENKAGSLYNIITKVDPSSGRWPSASITGLGRIAQKCLEPKHKDRVTIEEVSILSEAVAVLILLLGLDLS